MDAKANCWRIEFAWAWDSVGALLMKQRAAPLTGASGGLVR